MLQFALNALQHESLMQHRAYTCILLQNLAARAKWIANIGSKSAISLQRGPVDTKFQVEGVALHQPFFF